MGTHSTAWHNALFRGLVFTVLQIDELRTFIRGLHPACWLWLAIDPVSKAIPTLHLGKHTKQDAFTVVHNLSLRLAPDTIPAFTTDGLSAYFKALTAHFGSWSHPPRARKDHWIPSPTFSMAF